MRPPRRAHYCNSGAASPVAGAIGLRSIDIRVKACYKAADFPSIWLKGAEAFAAARAANPIHNRIPDAAAPAPAGPLGEMTMTLRNGIRGARGAPACARPLLALVAALVLVTGSVLSPALAAVEGRRITVGARRTCVFPICRRSPSWEGSTVTRP